MKINATNCASMGSYSYPVFTHCTSLNTLNIGDNVQNIPQYAFYSCSGLKSVTIPNSETSVGEGAFYDCSSLQSVVVGNGVTNLPNRVFGTGKNLKSLTIGSSVLSISEDVFRYSVSSSGSIRCWPIKTIWLTNTPPNGSDYAAGWVNYVTNDLYSGLNNKKIYPFLNNMFVADGIRYVPVNPSECTCDAIDCVYSDTVSSVCLSDKVTFKGIEMKLQEMGEYLFYGNDFLQDVKIGDSVTSIGRQTFSGCSSLKHLSFGSSLKSIGAEAFSDCSSVTRIISRAQTPPTSGIQALDDINKWECKLIVPASSITAYQKADQWKEFFFIEDIESGIADLKSDKPTGEHYFTIDGKRINKLQKGVNIVVIPDGTTRKVVVK